MKCYVFTNRRPHTKVFAVRSEKKARALVQTMQGQGVPAAYCCGVGSGRWPENAENAQWRSLRRRLSAGKERQR